MAGPRQPHGKSKIRNQLHALGVRAGDSLMLHASLRKLGPVEDGVPGLIDALKDSVGPEGTLVMILGAELDWFLVSQSPTQSAEELARIHAPFDYLSTPALREVGYLAEAFRRSPDVLVSNHPDGRFAAWGARAQALLHETPWDHYYGPDSVLHRFCNQGGRILRMGADLNTVNVLHFSEYLANLEAKRERTITFLVQGGEGPEFRSVTSLNNEHGIVDWSGEDYFKLIVESYLREGHGKRGLVGGAESELFEAEDMVKYGTLWMEEHLPGGWPEGLCLKRSTHGSALQRAQYIADSGQIGSEQGVKKLLIKPENDSWQ